MDPLKEAFDKIKQDIEELRDTIFALSHEVNSIKKEHVSFYPISNMIYIPTDNFALNYHKTTSTNNYLYSHTPSLNLDSQTDNQTEKEGLESLKKENISFSNGNKGVQTDRQTDNPSDRQLIPTETNSSLENNLNLKPSQVPLQSTLSYANEVISSLDHLKSDISSKFNSLTTQEITVFSALYSLEDEQTQEITYKLLANKLSLTESSIRDYINKLIQKGIPICKTKQNNKKILLSIDPSLKKIASLPTILALRESNFIDDKNKNSLSNY